MAISPDRPARQQPSHPNLIQVHSVPGMYSSYATSLVPLKAGALFSPITNHFFVANRTWATVETSWGRHIDLNSDLYYANHSCHPSLEFDVNRMEVRVSRFRDLNVEDVLSFFYLSTEWHMAQPFDGFCKGTGCMGEVAGAGQMGRAKLTGFWLSHHIEERLQTMDG